jgi:hypothetical protein
VRKQYSFWPGEAGLDAWDVDRLVEASADFPVTPVALAEIVEVDRPYWGNEAATPRWLAEHARLVAEADASYPIILSAEGRVMDGMHRVVRAMVEGRDRLDAVRFAVTPPPDYRGVDPDELPY